VTLAPQAPASRRPAPRDRFRGALLGLAVGDALGAPAEFLTELEVRDRWGVLDEMVGGGCHDVAPGEVTDATEMMLALADSLVALGEFDPQDVVDRYRAWFAAGPSDVSLTTRTVMLALAAGTPWDLAARRAYEVLGFPTAGNGSVMRCAPLALRFFNDRIAGRLARQMATARETPASGRVSLDPSAPPTGADPDPTTVMLKPMWLLCHPHHRSFCESVDRETSRRFPSMRSQRLWCCLGLSPEKPQRRTRRRRSDRCWRFTD